MIKDARHYDTIVAPVITEKATIASENNQVVFKVARNATKPQIKAAVEKLFDVKVTSVNTLLRKGKAKTFRGIRGPTAGHEEGDRHACRRPSHRRDQRPLRTKDHGSQDIQADDAGHSPARHRRSQRASQGQAHQGFDGRQVREGRSQQCGPGHGALPRRRPQAVVPHRRLQAPQARRRRQGRAAGVRSQPHELHRADQICGRRAGLYHRAAAPCGRGRGGCRRAGRHEARQCDAARQHSGRHDRSQCRDEDRQGRRDRALGRLLRADRRPRSGLCLLAPEFRRAAPDPRPVFRHCWRGVESRSHERFARQGGPQPLARAACRTTAASP